MRVPSIFNYTNYREFLGDYYVFAKGEQHGFTYEKFSRKAGVKSPNLLKLIIDKKKSLTPDTLLKFAKALDLDSTETEYFEALVLENQADFNETKSYFKRRLTALKGEGSVRPLKVNAKSGLFDNPLMTPAIVLLSQESTKSAPEKLQKQLGLSDYEAQRFITSLLEKSIMRDENGRYSFDFQQGIFYKETPDATLKAYLAANLKLSHKAFAAQFDKGAKFFSHSMGVPVDRYREFIDEIDRFISVLNKKYDHEPAEKVLQLNLQCFWLENSVMRLR